MFIVHEHPLIIVAIILVAAFILAFLLSKNDPIGF